MKYRIAILVLCFLIITFLTDSMAQWEQTNGPPGGNVNSMAVKGGSLFVGTQQGALFHSTSNGVSWTPVFVGAAVHSLLVDGNNLFAGTGGEGVFLSTNDGTTWTQINTGLSSTNVSSLAIIGSNLFTGTYHDGIFLSTNNGISWTAANTGLTNKKVRAMVAVGTDLFAGTEDGGVFRSTNNGTSWTAVNSGLTNLNINAITHNSLGILFVGTGGGGVFRSTNNGTSWTAVNSGLSCLYIFSFAVKGTNLYAGNHCGMGVFLSTNNGTTWSPANSGLTPQNVEAMVFSGDSLFAGTSSYGVFVSTDNGSSWNASNSDFYGLDIPAFAIKDTDIFAGSWGCGVFHSTNNGTDWAKVNTGLTNEFVWSLLQLGTNLFASTYGGGVYRSANKGTSWTQVNNGLTNTDVRALTSGTSGNIFAGTFGGGVFLTTNNGTSWTAVNTGLTNTNVRALANDSLGNFFAGTAGGGVFRSTNVGASWTAVNSNITHLDIQKFTCNSPGTLFIATSSGGVFRSTNSGTNWTAFNTGLTNYEVLTLASDSSGNIFAGTRDGVFQCSKNGSSWTAVSSGLGDMGVWALATTDTFLFAGTVARSIWKAPLRIIDLDPPALDFGYVSSEEPSMLIVEVRNNGISSIDISSVYPDNPSFDVSPGGATVPPLGTEYFEIIFAPISPWGTKSGVIIFEHNGADSPFILQVDGIGYSLVVNSVQNGNWSDGATWDQGFPPREDQGVIIDHTVTMTANEAVNAVTVNNGGVIDMGIYQLTLSGTFALAAGAEAKMSGDYRAMPGAGTTPYNFNPASDFTFYGSITGFWFSPNPSIAFGNVNWNSTSSTTFHPGTVITGNLTHNGAAEFRFGTGTIASRVIPVHGNVTVNSGVLVMSNSVAPRTGALDLWGDLIINPGATLRGVNLDGSGTLMIDGNLINNGGTIEVGAGSGDFIVNFKGTENTNFDPGVTNAFRTVIIDADRTVNMINNNMTIDSGYTMTNNGIFFCGTNVVAGDGNFTLSSGGTLGIGSHAGITSSGASGNIQVTGTRTYNANTNYIYNGSVAQVTGDGFPEIVNNLTIDNTTGLSLSGNTTVSGTLNLANGNLDTESNFLTIAKSGSVSRTDDYIVGNLKKYVSVSAGSGSQLWEIGDVNYTPVNISGSSFSGDFDVTVSTAPGDHPDIASSAIDPTKSVNRRYTLSGVPTGPSSITFNFDVADIDVSADTSNFYVGKYNAPTWIYPEIVNRTATSIQATSIISFSDFAIGEPLVNMYIVDATTDGNGTINPAGALNVPSGSDQSFTITPDLYYIIDSVFIDNTHVDSTSSYTFYNVTSNHTIQAKFLINTFDIIATAGPNGSITPSGTVKVEGLNDTAFIFTPDPCYHVDSVFVDGSYVPDSTSSYTFKDVLGNHTIHVIFALNKYAITVSHGPHGAITPGTTILNCDGSQSLTIIPDEGYHVDSVFVDGGYIGAVTSYNFANVTSDHTIHAKFFINYTSNVIWGMKFNDINGNGQRDIGEVGVAGWEIRLVRIDSTGPLSTFTDSAGYYAFADIADGRYVVMEVNQPHWVQTYPSPPAVYVVNIAGGGVHSARDFGNKYGRSFQGSPGGLWSNPGNWEGGDVPNGDDAVIIPIDVVVDSLPNDSILALRIMKDANLTFGAGASVLKIRQGVKIDEGGTVTAAATELVCYGHWQNNGNFAHGTSAVTFAGNDEKVIYGTTFFNLNIAGPNTRLEDNVGISNTLSIAYTLTPGPSDTVFIYNTSVDAITGDGVIGQGTISRGILQGTTGIYRFESPLSYIQFDGTGSYPSNIRITTLPDSLPPSGKLQWELLGGQVDTVENTITVDSVRKFSKWPFGRPRPSTSSISIGTPEVNRVYVVDAAGGSDYLATVQFKYIQSEVPLSVDESELRLLRGPYFIDSINANWNMVSLPVEPEYNNVESLFPEALSDAFSYDSAEYKSQPILHIGKGYWLKFSSRQEAAMIGDHFETLLITLREGWNLIGTISQPIDVASVVTFPPDIIVSQFFGYSMGYLTADSLYPLHAYWIKVSQDGEMILSTMGMSKIDKESKTAFESGLYNKLVVSDASGCEQILYFGKDDKVNNNLFELPPLPPSGLFDARFSTGRMLEVVDSGQSKKVPIQISSDSYPLTIKWEIRNSSMRSMLLIGGREVKMYKNGQEKILESAETIQLYLSGIAGDGLPMDYALAQNYPNPFNPITTIEYQLPADSRVTLKIFDILGQVVISLVDDVQEAGFKWVEFDASNYASGIYFYRIEAINISDPGKNFIKVRKMILMK